ncbi:trypsin-like serine peptidase [Sphingobacterium anhuiense]|uniref:trypsin-like serine peptidase n=1 Tax=Sphingobacterium anhuiense TaxID=493780 RepID=UPI003C30561D
MKNQTIFIPIDGNYPEHVKDTTLYPYNTVGLLRFKFGDKPFMGTATLIRFNSDKDSKFLLTCAHNLYDKKLGYARDVTFTRAYNDPKKPFEPIKAKAFYIPEIYKDVALPLLTNPIDIAEADLAEHAKYDYALIKLDESISCDNIYQLQVPSDSDLLNLMVHIDGYGYFKKEMSHAFGVIKSFDQNRLYYGISTKSGSSGSAIVNTKSNQIVGIHTHGLVQKKVNAGVRMTDEIYQELLEWSTFV